MTSTERRPVTILTVEEGDKPGLARVAPALQQAGYRVREARRGEEALGLAAEQPDLVLLDVRLPDASGFDVCRKLKADSATAHIPVVYMYPSSMVRAEQSNEQLAGEADGFMVKPSEPAALLATVRAFLRVRQTEEAAGEWQRLMEASPDAALLLDRAGVVRRCNPALGSLLNRRADDVLGRRLADVADPTLAEAVGACLDADRSPPARLVMLAGRHFRLTCTPVPAGPGCPAGFVCQLAEVTDWISASLATPAGAFFTGDTEQYRQMLEATAEGIVRLDAAGRFTYVNRAAAALLGYTVEELHGRPMHALVHHSLADGAAYAADQCPILRALRTRQPCRVENEVFWNRACQSFSVEYQVTPADGGAVVTFRDVSEHKRLEERFRHSQKMEPVGRLASGVTHDFNNLLTIISGYCEILLGRLEPGDPTREMLVEIKKAEERAAELTRQLLAFSRKQVIEPKLLDLNAVIEEVSKLLRRLIGEDVELALEPGSDLGRVRADMGQLEQVLLNLAVNARDAMPHGGQLTLRTANVTLRGADARAAGAAPGNYVLLEVSDTGTGMTDEVRAHLFEPFFTTKEVGKGTGLGLSTVYGIITQSGGSITVDSAPGRGSTFRIYLPYASEAPRPGAVPPAPSSYQGSETILVTEEDPGLSELISKVLTPLGYTVLAARNGAEAVQISSAYPGDIHLLMCDVVLPQTTGRELFHRLSAARPELRVLFVSGYANGLLAAESDAPVLQKPFATEALARKVREVLARVPVG